MIKTDSQPEIWHGCYEEGWRDYILPDAFVHPAKFAKNLIDRILRDGLERGYFKPGDIIGDPFGGVGTGGILAAYAGLRWVGVELEEKFYTLAKANFEKHRRTLEGFNDPLPVILNGDSRRFAELVAPVAAVVTSPPYADSDQNYASGWKYIDPAKSVHNRYSRQREASYGKTDGQISALPSGSIDAVVTSPPYADAGQGGGADTPPSQVKTAGKSISLRDGYGETAGQIGKLQPGDLDAVVTSPPYEDGLGHGGGRADNPLYIEKKIGTQVIDQYGTAAGQIGAEAGETYWTAMKAVYVQCLLALKPGGVMYVVLKDYVKDGQRVPLCDQSARLLEAVGFRVERRIRAMLVKEQRTPALFGGEHVVKTERKSFFRRLHEAKGSPRIDWEMVLVCFRPEPPCPSP